MSRVFPEPGSISSIIDSRASPVVIQKVLEHHRMWPCENSIVSLETSPLLNKPRLRCGAIWILCSTMQWSPRIDSQLQGPWSKPHNSLVSFLYLFYFCSFSFYGGLTLFRIWGVMPCCTQSSLLILCSEIILECALEIMDIQPRSIVCKASLSTVNLTHYTISLIQFGDVYTYKVRYCGQFLTALC